ncbi:GATA zinc finger domain-containing protein 14-like, partial [Argonauta hians]
NRGAHSMHASDFSSLYIYNMEKINSKIPGLGGGLYRDDGLLTIRGVDRGGGLERIRKQLREIFRGEGLDITFSADHKIANFLDITLNLHTGTFAPYRKLLEKTKYVNKESNHPPNVLKGIHRSVSDRISKLSSSQEIFDEFKGYYEQALSSAGYTEPLVYHQ